jgi:hypothetical protein
MFEKASRLPRRPPEMNRTHDTGIPGPSRHKKGQKTRNPYSKLEATGHHLSFPQSPIDPKRETQDGQFQSNLKVDKFQF